jgi:putative ATP-dependent endonuclease of OLD family
MTTHSPYFVQHVPLRDLRLVRLRGGCTELAWIPEKIVSELPWTTAIDGLVRGDTARRIFVKDTASGKVAAKSWFNVTMANALGQCYRDDTDVAAKAAAADAFRHACRILPSSSDEEELVFHGRRVRGEVFFARRWILVEGVCEYLLLHALGKALGWPLDAHGVSVIDFQQSGNPGIYLALATAFDMPWQMVVDGDAANAKFQQQIFDRGFAQADLNGRFFALPATYDLEDQLIADGHEQLLRDILFEAGVQTARTCTLDEFRSQLNNRKTAYMAPLALRVSTDVALAQQMPRAFVDLVVGLRDGTL